MLSKVRALHRRIRLGQHPCEIQVDGGINAKTAPLAAEAGATSLVAGSAVYDGQDPAAAFRRLQSLIDLPVGTEVK
jgi:ribulose-phosphate 3-epimerase